VRRIVGVDHVAGDAVAVVAQQVGHDVGNPPVRIGLLGIDRHRVDCDAMVFQFSGLRVLAPASGVGSSTAAAAMAFAL
jgi:hypothetical protein